MLPESPNFEAVEISANLSVDEALRDYPSIANRAVFCNSDAHWLEAIGLKRTKLDLQHRSVAEITMACRGEGGRAVLDA